MAIWTPRSSPWRCCPNAPWTAGDYEIVVPTILEDLALARYATR